MKKSQSLRRLLAFKKNTAITSEQKFKDEIEELQLKMLRIQQGVWHKKERAVIVFEGFDAAGKGGAIRKLTEVLDPRGFKVHPIGPPTPEEQGKHWLYRFWTLLPAPGTIAIFDRSWYGRVLVERVDKLTPEARWKQAYNEINQFESMLKSDGIEVVKIFLGISKSEQLKRFKDRMQDPYKQWKLTPDDLRARKKWNQYVGAVEDIFKHTGKQVCPWHLIHADNKHFTRLEVLKAVTTRLKPAGVWMEKNAGKRKPSL
jgi:polyphosphate kinase 2 (PPK2 family)